MDRPKFLTSSGKGKSRTNTDVRYGFCATAVSTSPNTSFLPSKLDTTYSSKKIRPMPYASNDPDILPITFISSPLRQPKAIPADDSTGKVVSPHAAQRDRKTMYRPNPLGPPFLLTSVNVSKSLALKASTSIHSGFSDTTYALIFSAYSIKRRDMMAAAPAHGSSFRGRDLATPLWSRLPVCSFLVWTALSLLLFRLATRRERRRPAHPPPLTCSSGEEQCRILLVKDEASDTAAHDANTRMTSFLARNMLYVGRVED
mmetsp:Transcript_32205/g.94798  ORF Transcript_32205/g.94798 Transcript_32205/m.94798 type:complete len:258 (+) Transcript_32205:2189-2962(+)